MLYGSKARLQQLSKARSSLVKSESLEVTIGCTSIGIPTSAVLEEVEKEIAFLERIIKEAEGE